MQITLGKDNVYMPGFGKTEKGTTQSWKVIKKIGKDFVLERGRDRIIIVGDEYKARKKVVEPTLFLPSGAKYLLKLVTRKPSFWERLRSQMHL